MMLTNGQSNQRALADRLSKACDLVCVVVSRNIPRKKPSMAARIRTFGNRVAGRTAGRVFVDAWSELLRSYEVGFPHFPHVDTVHVSNVNDDETSSAIRRHQPDLIVVSGTNLVGKRLIGEAGRMVNLHTGISPYVKGGPNCTNWCLARKWFDLIGNTVMWLDAGIDSGGIITTERTALDGAESLTELHRKVMDHGHDLYVRAISRIGEGAEVKSIPQDEIAQGHVFFNADWNAKEMRLASKNFRESYRTHFEADLPKDPGVRLVSLD